MRVRPIHTALLLLLVTLAGGALRGYGLGHGVPYHFHADEMLALRGAVLLRASPELAAESAKFFIYPVLPKRLLGLATAAYESARRPLDLGTRRDSGTLMLMGRAISAAASIAMIPLVFLAGRRVSGPVAGLLAASLAASAVVSIASGHFFTADSLLALFCAASLLGITAVAQTGRAGWYVFAGAAIGVALACKYTAGFLLLPLATAHLLSARRPAPGAGLRAWSGWLAIGLLPLAVAAACFLAVNPLVVEYPQRFLQDIREGIVEPNFSAGGPIWTAQFADVALRPFWFTNLLPWNLGPAFALGALAGVIWLVVRRDRVALAVASYAAFYYVVASPTTTPYSRYVLPLVPGLAVAAGALSADLLGRAPRRLWVVCAALVQVLTWGWALAYLNVYREPDVRIAAARFIDRSVPDGARILVEPSHNTPPMGSYLYKPALFTDYVGWGADTVREDRVTMFTLDTYRHLYDGPLPPDVKRQYIRDRLARVDYIVMDDTFVEFYQHLHGPEHAPVREYYRDLFAGRLGFRLLRAFEVTPALFGLAIDDDDAEMTFALFDHPRVYVFERTTTPGARR